MAFRDFDADRREVEHEPIQFKLAGRTWTTVSPLPLGAALVLAAETSSLPGQEAEAAAVAGTVRVLRRWIVEDERDAWDEALSGLADPTVVGDLMAWIVEEATGRPTQAS